MAAEREDHNRRDFLAGKPLRDFSDQSGGNLQARGTRNIPQGGSTLRLSTRAMACDFSVLLNPDPGQPLDDVSCVLEQLHPLEQMMTIYRDDSELSRVNQQTRTKRVAVSHELWNLLDRCRELSLQTQGAFDATSGPLIRLWQQCRSEQRIPKQDQVSRCLEHVGMHHVEFDSELRQVHFKRPGMDLNLGAIGKGYALDRLVCSFQEVGVNHFLLHGGHSSITARGNHAGLDGWPVGMRNPLFANERYATVLLRNQAMATSGSNIQFYRSEGRRWGHILDPRSGWPAEELVSCSVIAPTAEQADALSTAFFVAGVEKAREYCDTHRDVQALLFPQPKDGRRVEPVNCGMTEDVLFRHGER